MSILETNCAIHLSVALLAGITAGTTSGEVVRIVVPNASENTEGDTLTVDCCENTPFRSQMVFPASEFGSLPETHRWVIGLAGRPDLSVTEPREVNWPDFQLRFSTTTKGPGELDTLFANNIGDKVVAVYDGPVTYSTAAPGPAEGPQPFDYYVPFQTPFFYDPTSGKNLLWDFVTLSGPTTRPTFDAATLPLPRGITGFGTNPTSGQVYGSHVYVAQFVFAPTVPGDYNGNGAVDAADYTVWRDTLGSKTDMRANGDNSGASVGVIDGADYDVWKAHFGETAGGGAGHGLSLQEGIPEPASLVLVVLAAAGLLVRPPARRQT